MIYSTNWLFTFPQSQWTDKLQCTCIYVCIMHMCLRQCVCACAPCVCRESQSDRQTIPRSDSFFPSDVDIASCII